MSLALHIDAASLWIGIALGIVAGMALVHGFVVRNRNRQLLENRLMMQRQADLLVDRQADIRAVTARLEETESNRSALQIALTQCEERLETTRSEIALLKDFRTTLTDTYKSLATDILRENHRDFEHTAANLLAQYIETIGKESTVREQQVLEIVRPVQQSLQRYEIQMRELERLRQDAYAGLREQLRSLADLQRLLQKETGKLANALRLPHVRGRWGELTLRRVVEMAGMVDRCDFVEQESFSAEAGLLRPDMIVRLPGERRIAVDAKAPLSAYLEALDAESDAERSEKMALHARQLAGHIQKLAQKAYWEQIQPAPELVVLFIPGENFFSAALMQDGDLIELAARKGVMLATPITLITLLKTAAYAWNQETTARNIQAIRELGCELHDRLCGIAQHLNRLGKDLEKSVLSFNQLSGAFERRVLVSSRKFAELGIGKDGRKSLGSVISIEERPKIADRNGENGED
ncbi:DNA recombination protein RmuC [Desulfatirhabdium butyrativorans]|uniref:DNA recombination protein RmuC n=1 Tax=Desulfatirhabdium butyrativorans TaxID=340467 RepID=UPI000426E041|nr:DNA recombination protein RmuC [Desulfatirhabdium butyrativorans]